MKRFVSSHTETLLKIFVIRQGPGKSTIGYTILQLIKKSSEYPNTSK